MRFCGVVVGLMGGLLAVLPCGAAEKFNALGLAPVRMSFDQVAKMEGGGTRPVRYLGYGWAYGKADKTLYILTSNGVWRAAKSGLESEPDSLCICAAGCWVKNGPDKKGTLLLRMGDAVIRAAEMTVPAGRIADFGDGVIVAGEAQKPPFTATRYAAGRPPKEIVIRNASFPPGVFNQGFAWVETNAQGIVGHVVTARPAGNHVVPAGYFASIPVSSASSTRIILQKLPAALRHSPDIMKIVMLPPAKWEGYFAWDPSTGELKDLKTKTRMIMMNGVLSTVTEDGVVEKVFDNNLRPLPLAAGKPIGVHAGQQFAPFCFAVINQGADSSAVYDLVTGMRLCDFDEDASPTMWGCFARTIIDGERGFIDLLEGRKPEDVLKFVGVLPR